MKLKKIIPTLHLLQKSRLSGKGCTVSKGKQTELRKRDRGRKKRMEGREEKEGGMN